MRNGAVRRAGRCLGLTVAAGVSTAAGAQARTGVLVSTGLSAETNPYNDAAGRGTSAALTAEVQPVVSWRTDRSTFDIRGLAQFRQFVRRYGLEDNYGADANVVTQTSDRVTLHAAAGGQYNQGGFGGFGRPALSPGFGVGGPAGEQVLDPVVSDPTLPTNTVPATTLPGQLPLLTDVTVLGQRLRTTSLYGRAGVDARISARSQVGADVDVRASRFKGASFSDFNSARGEARYSWQVNELTSVGVIGSAERIDYLGRRIGDSTIYSGLLSYQRRFSRQWEASIGAGVSVAKIAQLPGVRNVSLTSFSIQGRFCWAAEYSRLCVSGSRSPQPAAIGGVRVSETVAVTYSQRLSDREGLTLGGSYSRTGEAPGAAFAQPAVKFASGSARYDNQIGARTVLFASGSVSKIYGFNAPRRANFGVTTGIQFRLGAFK